MCWETYITPSARAIAAEKPLRVLSVNQVVSFIERGYCRLKAAFTTEQAAEARDCVWRRMRVKARIRKEDYTTWPEVYDIEEHLSDKPVLDCFTDRLSNAIEDLVGPGRWTGSRQWGLWPVNFSLGASEVYRIPDYGWHIDGNWFRHTLDCPKQGLLIIGMFSDIKSRWGGTIVSEGSHKRTAHVLAGHPEGLHHRELFNLVLQHPIGGFRELTANVGDVVLAHPFLFHTRGFKHAGPPRFISNTEAPLREPMLLHRERMEEYSVLELSIREALSTPPPIPPDAMQCRY